MDLCSFEMVRHKFCIFIATSTLPDRKYEQRITIHLSQPQIRKVHHFRTQHFVLWSNHSSASNNALSVKSLMNE